MKDLADRLAESGTEVTVDERVYAAVRRAEPLRQRNEVALEDLLLGGAHPPPVGEHQSDVNRVQRQPRQGEQHENDDQHTKDLRLRPADVAFRSRAAHADDAAPADLDADEEVEDGDEGERKEVAGDEDDADGEGAIQLDGRPVGVTGDEDGRAGSDDVALFAVDEDPRHEEQRRDEPEDGDDEAGALCRYLRRPREEYRQIPETTH